MIELVQPPRTLREGVLLLELNHLFNNEFASAINYISVAAVQTDNVGVKTALSQVVELLHQHADVHRALTTPDRDEVIDAAQYLQTLCITMSRSDLDAWISSSYLRLRPCGSIRRGAGNWE